MVFLISNYQLLDDYYITGSPIDDTLEARWLRASSRDAHQNQARMGFHAEKIPCLQLQQEIGIAAVQTNQEDSGVVIDTSGVPPYLKRKLLMHHGGTIYSPLVGFCKEIDRQNNNRQDKLDQLLRLQGVWRENGYTRRY